MCITIHWPEICSRTHILDRVFVSTVKWWALCILQWRYIFSCWHFNLLYRLHSLDVSLQNVTVTLPFADPTTTCDYVVIYCTFKTSVKSLISNKLSQSLIYLEEHGSCWKRIYEVHFNILMSKDRFSDDVSQRNLNGRGTQIRGAAGSCPTVVK